MSNKDAKTPVAQKVVVPNIPTNVPESDASPLVNTMAGTYGQNEAAADAALETIIQQEQKVIKAKMKSEASVPVLIPADPLNHSLTVVPVLINGVKFDIPVGKMVKVPQSVAAVLADSDYIAPKLTVETFDNIEMP